MSRYDYLFMCWILDSLLNFMYLCVTRIFMDRKECLVCKQKKLTEFMPLISLNYFFPMILCKTDKLLILSISDFSSCISSLSLDI